MEQDNDLALLQRFTEAVEKSKGGELPPYNPDQIEKFIRLIDQQEEEIRRRIEALTTCLDNADTLLHVSPGCDVTIEYHPADYPVRSYDSTNYFGPKTKGPGDYRKTDFSRKDIIRISEAVRSPCYKTTIERWYSAHVSQDRDDCDGVYAMNDNGFVEKNTDDQFQLNRPEIIGPIEFPIGPIISSGLKREGEAMLATFFRVKSRVRNCLHCPLKINPQNVDAKTASARAGKEIDRLQGVIDKFERTKQKLLTR
ncbi:MAG: hypothetical protein US89_C0014G0018 [Candidatus Peregrinibacteria bacterium GW2011_GWF2_38_29]|nr:MAG: hypothetical protein US89_C0014G0018 [Candidatus Peregrinibacteria bacterium GW2011_GWF2_38_29]HBB02574.1 hypothetical protein [Candidatus Peregrinibacteria bacterium]